jgi:hypothetical protein
MKTLRKPRLNICVVKVAVETRRICASVVSAKLVMGSSPFGQR